ncbi:MAG TPA: hypothetical protein VFC79_08135 [Tissierellaceae bacterium]|nr:hypothetical protein [Tissierellaceae bacterium]
MAVRLQIRNGTASEWTSVNPLLMEGELALEKDTRKFKIGNGMDNWNDLPYATQGEQGEKGEPFIYDDFTEEQLEELRGPRGLPGSIDNFSSANIEEALGYIPQNLPNVDNLKQMPISNGVLENYREKSNTTTGEINLNLGNVFYRNATANTTFTITNAVTNQAHSFTLIIDMGAVVTLTFPASVVWQGGEIPDMTTANKTYILTFLSINGGATWFGNGSDY